MVNYKKMSKRHLIRLIESLHMLLDSCIDDTEEYAIEKIKKTEPHLEKVTEEKKAKYVSERLKSYIRCAQAIILDFNVKPKENKG